MERFAWKLYGIFRAIWFLPNNIYATIPYFGWMFLLQPLFFVSQPMYYVIEGYLYKWLLAMVGAYVQHAGIAVMEDGEDLSVYTNDRCLVIVNHQDSLDVPILMLAVQDKAWVCRYMTWIMDVMFKYSHFGIVGKSHGDIFVESGKAAREKSLQVLKQSLEDIYLPRGRQWLMLFPEGGYLRNMKPGSIKYAAKMGYPQLENVALPRVGALEIILDTLASNVNTNGCTNSQHTNNSSDKLKWIIDITIGYPQGRPITISDCVLCRGSPQHVTLFYRVYSVNDVPRDSAALTQWIHDRYVEKDAMLAEYARTGHFPRVHTSSSNTSMSTANTSVEGVRERYLAVTNTFLVSLHAFWLVSCYVQYHMVRYTLGTVWSLLV